MEINGNITRRMLLRRLAGGAVAAAMLPLLSACGGDDEAEPTSTSGSTSSPTTGTTSAPTATPRAASSPATGGTPTTTATPATSSTPRTTGTPAGTPVRGGSLTIYSGRNENLVGKLIDDYKSRTGTNIQVRYGDSAELAAAILEEGNNSPADIFFSQDAGALGAVGLEGLLQALPQATLGKVDSRFRSPNGQWVGVSGRARAVVYNTEQLSEADIPASILDFTDAKWRDKLGWAPTNASLQAFVTALRVLRGEQAARAWLTGIKNNGVKVYQGNAPIVRAVIAGEIQAGFVNHYYLHAERKSAGRSLPAENFIYKNGDPGALVNVAGAALLRSAKNKAQAQSFIDFLLSQEAQTYFAEQTFEYPLIPGVPTAAALVPLNEIQTPDIDLSDLADLEGTLELMQDVGVL